MGIGYELRARVRRQSLSSEGEGVRYDNFIEIKRELLQSHEDQSLKMIYSRAGLSLDL